MCFGFTVEGSVGRPLSPDDDESRTAHGAGAIRLHAYGEEHAQAGIERHAIEMPRSGAGFADDAVAVVEFDLHVIASDLRGKCVSILRRERTAVAEPAIGVAPFSVAFLVGEFRP